MNRVGGVGAGRWAVILGMAALCAACASGVPAPAAGAAVAPPPGMALAWTRESCAAGREVAGDADADGVADGCETALASAFAPRLVTDATECGWDAGLGRLGGEYLYVVGGVPGSDRLRIAYLPAYYLDCGWHDPLCVLTPGACAGHTGDSEVIVVEVGFDTAGQRWQAEGVFLSAHCHGRSDGRCRWYRGRDLGAFAWVDGVRRGAPVVWVARGKHAGYPSRGACDAGHWRRDGCDRNRAAYRFPVERPRQNAGSRARPFGVAGGSGCIGTEFVGWGSAMPTPGATECIWRREGAFHGWRRPARGGEPAPYGRYLWERAGL